jgi:hypothetical protein
MKICIFSVIIFIFISSCIDTNKLIVLINNEIDIINKNRNEGEDLIENVKTIKVENNRYHCYSKNNELVVILDLKSNKLIGEIKINYYYIYDDGEEWRVS